MSDSQQLPLGCWAAPGSCMALNLTRVRNLTPDYAGTEVKALLLLSLVSCCLSRHRLFPCSFHGS
jgi:hypothetical protein